MAANITEDLIGAGIILYTSKLVLIGDESKYCTDEYPKKGDPAFCTRLMKSDGITAITPDELKKRQTLTLTNAIRADIMKEAGNPKMDDAKIAEYYFISMAQNMTANNLETLKKFGGKIRIDTPIHRGDDVYTVNYRFLPETPFSGIIKGGMNAGETARGTILREFREEVGIDLPHTEIVTEVGKEPKIIDLLETIGVIKNYKYYTLRVSTKFDTIDNAIRAKNSSYIGELYNLRFVPLKTISALGFNQRTKDALKLFIPFHTTKIAAETAAHAAAASGAASGAPIGGRRRTVAKKRRTVAKTRRTVIKKRAKTKRKN